MTKENQEKQNGRAEGGSGKNANRRSVVGQDEVDARVVVVGKHQARVVQDHVAVALEGGHVLADGVKTAASSPSTA